MALKDQAAKVVSFHTMLQSLALTREQDQRDQNKSRHHHNRRRSTCPNSVASSLPPSLPYHTNPVRQRTVRTSQTCTQRFTCTQSSSTTSGTGRHSSWL
eukprot:747935-Hanusia_phi.AAC.2